MKIKVLGAGCAKCKRLYAEVEKALATSGVDADLEKIEAIDEILKYEVMITPSLVIDSEVMCSGKIPSTAEIVGWIHAKSPSFT